MHLILAAAASFAFSLSASLMQQSGGTSISNPVSVRTKKADHPREISADALAAASGGTLEKWALPWQQRLRARPADREAMFAVAAMHRLKYEYNRADSLYLRILTSEGNDPLGGQAQLWRVLIRVNAGRYAQSAPQLLAIEQSALRMRDTLTALDAILAHSGIASRLESANAAFAIHARGDSLNWKREASLDSQSRCRLSALYSRVGNRERARALAREGYAIATRAALPRHAAGCLFTLATDFARVGLTDSLRAPLTDAIALQEKTGDLAGAAASKQWAGYYLITLGSVTAAQAQLTSAWSDAQRSNSPNTAAWIAINRAGLAQIFYDAAGASLWLGRADSLMHKVEDLQGAIELSRMQAVGAQRAGDLTTARRHLRAAKLEVDKLGEPSLQFTMLGALWELAMERNDLGEATAIAEERRLLLERSKMTGWQMNVVMEDAELALHKRQPEKAMAHLDWIDSVLHPSQKKYIYIAQEERAVALTQLGDIKGAAKIALSSGETFDKFRASLNDQSLRSLSVQGQRSQGWFTSSLIANLADAGEVEVAFTLTERRRARDLRDRLALASTLSSRAGAQRDTTGQGTLSVAELQRALPDNQTALVMMNAGEAGARGTAFVLTKRSISAHPLPTVEDLSPRVRRLVALLEAGRDPVTESRTLGASLISPLLPRLDSAGITRLVFLPEGVLHRLPFDVLRLPDGRFLIERFETAVAPSATVLVRLAAQPTRKSPAPRVLAFADARSTQPRNGDTTPQSPFFVALFGNSTILPRLLGARTEVNEVQRALPGTVVRTGLAATETEMKRDAGTFDVLHFATHAVVDEWSGASAALALTPTQTDDGLFDSSEIARLRLSASLVMLSACRTVGGEVLAGEGVRGLTSAFLEAGARSVIATGWRVNDRDVVPVVANIYQQLARSQPVGAALRSARLAAVRRKVSPSVWGAFTLVGDPWRVVVGNAASVGGQ